MLTVLNLDEFPSTYIMFAVRQNSVQHYKIFKLQQAAIDIFSSKFEIFYSKILISSIRRRRQTKSHIHKGELTKGMICTC